MIYPITRVVGVFSPPGDQPYLHVTGRRDSSRSEVLVLTLIHPPHAMPIGPALPPHLAHLTAPRSPSPPRVTTSEHPDDSDDDEDAFGPALPPHLAAARKGPQAGPSKPAIATFESPSPPRLPSSRAGPSAGPSAVPDDEDDSDDEVIGPVLPTEGVVERSAVEEFMEREQRMYAQKEVRGNDNLMYTEPMLMSRSPASSPSRKEKNGCSFPLPLGFSLRSTRCGSDQRHSPGRPRRLMLITLCGPRRLKKRRRGWPTKSPGSSARSRGKKSEGMRRLIGRGRG